MNPKKFDRLEKELQKVEAGSYGEELGDLTTEKAEAESEKPIQHKIEMLLADIEASGAVLFHDQYNAPYISYDGSGSRLSRLDSPEFRRWLAHHTWKKHKWALTSDVAGRTTGVLSGKAMFDGFECPLAVRHVFANDTLWYDMGDGRAVRITNSNWEVVEKPPILFRRFGHQKPQVMPGRNGDLSLLLKYINLNSEQRLLFLTYIVAAFIPDFPHPLLILSGPQGAGKTTPMQIMKELIDPSALRGLPAPTDLTAFVQTASHHSFLFFDNLSNMPSWFSDALARASTGDGFSKRELFTNDDDVIYNFQRAIALNGINQIVAKSDLLDRSILISLPRIEAGNRKEYSVIWEEFEHDRPYILGAIFDVLARVLATHPTVKLVSLPRMADYARWSYATAEAIGKDGSAFLKAYKQNIDIQNDEAIEASPVAQAILELMKGRQDWKGTAAELYGQLRKFIPGLELEGSRDWPRTAAALGKKLTPISPNLAAKGIELYRLPRSKERLIVIKRVAVVPDATVARLSKSDHMAKQIDNVRGVFGRVEDIGRSSSTSSDDSTTAATVERQAQQTVGHGDTP